MKLLVLLLNAIRRFDQRLDVVLALNRLGKVKVVFVSWLKQ